LGVITQNLRPKKWEWVITVKQYRLMDNLGRKAVAATAEVTEQKAHRDATRPIIDFAT
jgi:hypothetical protein